MRRRQLIRPGKNAGSEGSKESRGTDGWLLAKALARRQCCRRLQSDPSEAPHFLSNRIPLRPTISRRPERGRGAGGSRACWRK